MKTLINKTLIIAHIYLLCLVTLPSYAHLMVAQNGTLNFVDDKVYMVLSLPVSAFNEINVGNDGKFSMIEFNEHRDAITESIEHNITMTNETTQLPILGLMLSPVVPHGQPNQINHHIDQLIVMGQFSLIEIVSKNFDFNVSLFGHSPEEQKLKITVTNSSNKEKTSFSLTPDAPKKALPINLSKDL